ncbi:MAG TPA: hypothetical protein PK402_05660 [Tepidisphaeraceae bacterium]|nr:hypothetical protein [Tepidisphaeraceae bacterium]
MMYCERVNSTIHKVLALAIVLGGAQMALACDCHDPADPNADYSNGFGVGGPEGAASCSNIQGSVILGANSTSAVDIGGYIVCSEYDRYTIGGMLTFNGTLRVDLINGFIPEPGSSFRVFVFGDKSGDFHTLNNNGGVPGLIMTRAFTANAMDLNMSALPGDTDLDGDVDFADLLTVAQNYEIAQSPTWFDGDFDNTGTVTFPDLLIVAQNYGDHLLTNDSLMTETNATLAAQFDSDWALAQASIPEPASMALLAPLALMLRRSRR